MTHERLHETTNCSLIGELYTNIIIATPAWTVVSFIAVFMILTGVYVAAVFYWACFLPCLLHFASELNNKHSVS